jgi:hypothetical protein
MPPLDTDEMRAIVTKMWVLHQQELLTFNRIHDYVKGIIGFPQLPSSADTEVKAIANLSIKNVLAPVRDAFAENLSVVGYRTATSQDNLPAWKNWQANRMDARQSEIYRPALTYGVSYVCITPNPDPDNPVPVFRPRSPRQLISVYADAQIDQWPQYALETWVDTTGGRRTRRGMFFDDTYIYPLNLGPLLPTAVSDTDERLQNLFPISILDEENPPIPHHSQYCPVVRYINARDADDMVVGEIEPLIKLQRAITEVNFDRLIVARFGAFPQKVITGWNGTSEQVLQASAKRVWAFDDPDVKAYTLTPASLADYNDLLEEMMQHVAMVARISPSAVIGQMINVSADALAAAEAQEQRKLSSKRDSFGESHEQLLQCAAQIAGDQLTADDDQAEIQWRDTEARSFAAVVDGVSKLVLAGIPMQFLLPMIPGMTQQQMVGIERELQKIKTQQLLASLQQGGPPDQTGQPANGAAPPAQPDYGYAGQNQPGVPGLQPYAPPVVA